MSRRLRPGGIVAAVVLTVLTSTAAATAARTASNPIPAGYKGIEAKLPTQYPAPAKKGVACTIGFQNPVAANEFLGYVQRAVVAEGKRLGCKVITLDDALSPDKQVSNMQQLLAQKVGAIIFYPLDPKATTPVLQQAAADNVPVVAIDASFGNTKKVPLIATQVWQGRDVQAFLQAQMLAKSKPNANLGLIGIGIPVPAIKYFNGREAFWAKKIGKATVLGTQDNPSDDVTGGEKAANALLQRFSNVDAVIGYNDPSALGAVVASKGAGKTLTIIGCNGTSDGLAGIKNGTLAATVQVDPIGIGVQTARASYSLITKQHLPLPRIVIRPGRLVTKANVGRLPSWDVELKAVK